MIFDKLLEEILYARSEGEMNLYIGEILVREDTPRIRKAIMLNAEKKIRKEGWGSNYTIPDVNGLGRPLTFDELEEIMDEDAQFHQRRKRGRKKF